jgi:hypothetical protein
MIDTKLVENIRAYGTCKGLGEERRKILVDDIGFKISKKAVDLMYHAKRRTVTSEDIRLSASE